MCTPLYRASSGRNTGSPLSTSWPIKTGGGGVGGGRCVVGGAMLAANGDVLGVNRLRGLLTDSDVRLRVRSGLSSCSGRRSALARSTASTKAQLINVYSARHSVKSALV